MAKKDKKRSADEAGLVAVDPEATSAAGIGMPTANEGETMMEVDSSSVVKKVKKVKKSKESKKDKSEGKDLQIPADALSPIAHPLAGRKLAKKTLKTVKKGGLCRLL